MAVESRGDLASRHGSIVRIAVAHSGSYRSDNPICTGTPLNGRKKLVGVREDRAPVTARGSSRQGVRPVDALRDRGSYQKSEVFA